MLEEEKRAIYDPKIHAGIINIEGRDFIITDPELAGLDKFPLEYREVIAGQTKVAIEMVLEKAKISAEGYQRGIALLRLPDGS